MTVAGDASDTRLDTRLVVRVWLPDRPGALGLVASRIGAIGADIVGIDVLERSERVAVGESGPDDLAVAPLERHGTVLLVGRDGHPFRRRERRQLLALARIADRVASILGT